MESCLCRTVKKMAQGDKESLDSSCSERIYSPFLASRVCSCDPACVAARWVQATWNVNGRSWRGITVKAFGTMAFTTWRVHFLHFDESCRRLHWFAGSPLKLRPLSSRWGKAPRELESPKHTWHAANTTSCLSVLLLCPRDRLSISRPDLLHPVSI